MNYESMTDRELNELVATKVMGYRKVGNVDVWVWRKKIDDTHYVDKPRWWSSSTSISDAWEVVEKLYELGFTVSVSNVSSMEYITEIYGREDKGAPTTHAWGSTAPRAICIAALKAIEQ